MATGYVLSDVATRLHSYCSRLRPTGKWRPAPHIYKMTIMEHPQADAGHHAAAIARWDDEGSASKSSPTKTGADVSKKTPMPQADGQKVDQAFAEDEQILGCLGAAVIMRWGTLPTKIQRELFEHATSLADLSQTVQLKGQIARFLHNHENDGARTTRAMPRQGMT
jgi:hypothetical protein